MSPHSQTPLSSGLASVLQAYERVGLTGPFPSEPLDRWVAGRPPSRELGRFFRRVVHAGIRERLLERVGRTALLTRFLDAVVGEWGAFNPLPALRRNPAFQPEVARRTADLLFQALAADVEKVLDLYARARLEGLLALREDGAALSETRLAELVRLASVGLPGIRTTELRIALARVLLAQLSLERVHLLSLWNTLREVPASMPTLLDKTVEPWLLLQKEWAPEERRSMLALFLERSRLSVEWWLMHLYDGRRPLPSEVLADLLSSPDSRLRLAALRASSLSSGGGGA